MQIIHNLDAANDIHLTRTEFHVAGCFLSLFYFIFFSSLPFTYPYVEEYSHKTADSNNLSTLSESVMSIRTCTHMQAFPERLRKERACAQFLFSSGRSFSNFE